VTDEQQFVKMILRMPSKLIINAAIQLRVLELAYTQVTPFLCNVIAIYSKIDQRLKKNGAALFKMASARNSCDGIG